MRSIPRAPSRAHPAGAAGSHGLPDGHNHDTWTVLLTFSPRLCYAPLMMNAHVMVLTRSGLSVVARPARS